MVTVAWWFTVGPNRGVSIWSPDSAHRWLCINPLGRVGDFPLGIFGARLYLNVRQRGPVPWLAKGWLAAAVATFIVIVMGSEVTYLTA